MAASVRRRADDDKLARRGVGTVTSRSSSGGPSPARLLAGATRPSLLSPNPHGSPPSSLFTPQPSLPPFGADRATPYDTVHLPLTWGRSTAGGGAGGGAVGPYGASAVEQPESYLRRLRDTVSSARRQREECEAQLLQELHLSALPTAKQRTTADRWTLPGASEATPSRYGPPLQQYTNSASARHAPSARELELEALMKSSHSLATSATVSAAAAMRVAAGQASEARPGDARRYPSPDRASYYPPSLTPRLRSPERGIDEHDTSGGHRKTWSPVWLL